MRSTLLNLSAPDGHAPRSWKLRLKSPSPTRRPPLVAVLLIALFPLGCLVGGGFLLTTAGPRLWEGLAARSWSEVTGRIADVRVDEVDLGGRGPGTKRWFEVRLRYDYVVDGREFSGDRVGEWPEHFLGPHAKEVAASFPVGRFVSVFYDRATPSRSLLDRSIGSRTIAMTLGGALLLAFGAVITIGFVRAVRRGA